MSEAYLQIFRALQRGGGPFEAFRPYLYRTIRNVALGWISKAPEVPLDEAAELPDTGPGPDAVVDSVVAEQAFRALPPRWQEVLWYIEVEGLKPAEAAAHLGMSANSVSALAYRAREGFKKEWLQAHVSERGVPAECQWSTRRMGDYATGSLTPRAKARFDAHLEACARCSAVLAELGGLSGRLAGLLLPVVISGSAAASLLASRSETVAAADVVRPDIPATKPYRSVTVAVASIALAAVGVTGAAWGVISTASAPTTVTAEPPAPQPPAPDGSEEPPGSGGVKNGARA